MTRPTLPATSLATRLMLGLVLVLALVLAFQSWRLRRAYEAAGQLALEADTLRASRDTTRVLQLQESLRVVQRQVVQRVPQVDALDKQLRLQRLALAQLQLEIHELRASVTSSTPTREDSSTGARQAHFDVRQAPYTVAADVALPRPPAPGQLEIQVRVDSAQLELRLGCSRADAAGIRSAQATVAGPPWLPLRLGRVEQSPDLCQSPALAKGSAPPWWHRLVPRVGAGYGLQLGQDGTVRAGWQLGAYLDVWSPVR